MRFSRASQFTRARFTGPLAALLGGVSAPAYPSTSNFTRRSMSFADSEAWKNSTPNCFTRCAGTVIMNPSASWGSKWRPDHDSRYLNPRQHVRFHAGRDALARGGFALARPARNTRGRHRPIPHQQEEYRARSPDSRRTGHHARGPRRLG